MHSIFSEFHTVPTLVTLLALGLIVYTYIGYPGVLWVVSKMRAPLKTPSGRPKRWPSVSVIISAHNEEAVISRRIRNLLEQDYPNARLQILVGSDGSTDRTIDEVRRYLSAKVQLAAFPDRRGKASVLNDLVGQATGQFLVFTDAATMFYPDSIKQLMTGFYQYPAASVIGGKLELQGPDTSSNADGLYWRYEMFLKLSESQLGAGLGASGAIYAIRRKDYQPMPPQTMADDLLEPMLIRLHKGGDVILYAAARAYQVMAQRVTDEFNRRVRTGAGILHVVTVTWRLLLPQHGLVSLAYWSHKVFRLLGPWILLAAMAGNLWLLDHWVYWGLLVAQIAVYGLSLSGGRLREIPFIGRAAVAARYFVVLNCALAMGSLKFMFGTARPTWDRTQRSTEPVMIPSSWPQQKTTKQNQKDWTAA